ncbi:MAG: SMC-Scp complex subunit ScpB, partial [Bacilli bacterium]|nr:SMC-Scp complex subunit ScpB [Bacilli bacterium]
MNLKAVLEGLLYVCGDEGLTFEKALAILGISKEELDEIVKKLEEEYDSPERGIKLESFGGKLKLVTKKEHSDYYKNLFNEEVNSGLSQSALEVLAIIAYNEPVTR